MQIYSTCDFSGGGGVGGGGGLDPLSAPLKLPMKLIVLTLNDVCTSPEKDILCNPRFKLL